jgi:hypothetical protein
MKTILENSKNISRIIEASIFILEEKKNIKRRNSVSEKKHSNKKKKLDNMVTMEDENI